MPKPRGAVVIPSKLVYTVKKDAAGNITRYKCRCVAVGYRQTAGRDYDPNGLFAPTLKRSTFLTVLATITEKKLFADQLDVVAAFLNGILKDVIYMSLPPGYKASYNGAPLDPRLVFICLLLKALYGLKQSPKVWNSTITLWLLKHGFIPSPADPCLFTRIKPGAVGQTAGGEIAGTYELVALFVDDMIIAGNNRARLTKFEQQMAKEYEVKLGGPLHWFLNMEIKRNAADHTLNLTQTAFIKSVVSKYLPDGADRYPNTPMASHMKYSKQQCPQTDEERQEISEKPYLELLGALLYIALATRPDIAFAVNLLSRFSSNPGMDHWKGLLNIVAYLKITSGIGITFKSSGRNNLRPTIFSDSDWAGDDDDKKSTLAYLVIIAGGPVDWRCAKQASVACSSTEAEYMSASEAVMEAAYLRLLLESLGEPAAQVITVMIDNDSAAHIAHMVALTRRTKHIEVRYHYIRDQIQKGVVVTQRVDSTMNIADLLTKALPAPQFKLLRDMFLLPYAAPIGE
jgi:hypothetical protein